MTTNTDTFDLSAFDGYQNDRTQLAATPYPFGQWRNGSLQAWGFAKSGGLFIPDTQIPPGIIVSGDAIELVTSSDPITGYGYTMFKCARLAHRLDWEPCLDPASGRYGRAMKSYDAALKECVVGRKPRGRTRFVVVITDVYVGNYDSKGSMTGGTWQPWLVDEDSKQPVYVPLMLTVKATNGIALNQVFKDHMTVYVNPAQKAWGVRLPDYGLLVPIQVGASYKPNPQAQGTTTPPKLLRPGGDPIELAKQLVPPKAVLEVCHAEWPAAQEWAKAELGGEFGEPEVASQEERGAAHAPDAGFLADTSDENF
jgi:hypothetical protein